MKNHSKRRLLIFAIVFVVFNILVFVIPFRRNEIFWIAYTFSSVTILAQIAVDVIAFHKADTMRRVFLAIPIIKISYIYLCIQLVVCALLMLISLMIDIPAWIVVIPCVLILAFAAIAIIKADWAREKIEEIDVNNLAETMFIHQLRADLDSLMPRISDSALKKKIEKLSKTVRCSDYFSDTGLAELETEIENKFASLKQAVISGGAEVGNLADELSFSLIERNNKCRVLRRQQLL